MSARWRRLDAVVALTADSLDLGMVKFGPSQIVLTNDRSRLVTELRKVSAYEGVISGQFVVNGRKGLSVGGDLSFAGMALQPLLADFGGYQRLVGTGDMRVKFLGSGASVDAIMQSVVGVWRSLRSAMVRFWAWILRGCCGRWTRLMSARGRRRFSTVWAAVSPWRVACCTMRIWC